MRLVVHMGATKAASSFLQRCLFLNEDALLQHGVYLPKTGRLDPSYATVTHHNLGWQLLGDANFRESGGGWDELIEELASVDADTVLLTSEAFARLAGDPRRRLRMAERLADVSDDVTLVYVVRDPLARINSMYEQTVKAFGTPSSFEDYATQSVKSGYYNLEESFRFWYESDRVTFLALRYDEMVAAGPFAALLGTLGVEIASDDLKIPDDATTRAPGPIAIEALRVLNVHLRIIDAGFSQRSPATIRLAQIAERRGTKFGWYDEKYWGWRRKQAEWATGRLDPSNQAFAQAVWGTDWPLASLVSKPNTAVNMILADRKINKELLAYLTTLTAKYRKLASPESSSGAGEDESDPGVIDASTLISDEAERATQIPTRRPPGRAST